MVQTVISRVTGRLTLGLRDSSHREDTKSVHPAATRQEWEDERLYVTSHKSDTKAAKRMNLKISDNESGAVILLRAPWNTVATAPAEPGETLTPCGHSAACRSSSRWRGRRRPESQSGRRRSPWSRFHRTPPAAQREADTG